MDRIRVFGWEPSVLALLVVSGVFFVALVAFSALTLLGRRPASEEQRRRGETVFLPLILREYWDWTISPVTRLLIRQRVNPNAITYFSLLASLGAGVAFAVGYAGLGGWLYILSGTCDVFDGKVARANGTTSRSGAFIDSTLDRYTEIFVLVGLAYFFRHSPVVWAVVAGICGSLMVSYTRARGEALGYTCREGGMQRAERIVYVGLAGVFGKLAEAVWPEREWSVTFLSFTLVLLAISSNFTAVQRFFSIVRALREQERGGPSPQPDPHPEPREPMLRKAEG